MPHNPLASRPRTRLPQRRARGMVLLVVLVVLALMLLAGALSVWWFGRVL